jgi:hypothetical protein
LTLREDVQRGVVGRRGKGRCNERRRERMMSEVVLVTGGLLCCGLLWSVLFPSKIELKQKGCYEQEITTEKEMGK